MNNMRLINIVLEVLDHAIKQEREIKDIRKEEINLSLFVDYIKVCVENPKEFTKKLLELVSEFSKVIGLT